MAMWYEVYISDSDITVFHAGTKLQDGQVVTNGGRVLSVTAVADDLPSAVVKSYAASERISFDNKYFRRDIGRAALNALERK